MRRYPKPSAGRAHLSGLILGQHDRVLEAILPKVPALRSGMILSAKPEPHWQQLFRDEVASLVASTPWKTRFEALAINSRAVALWAARRDGLPILLGNNNLIGPDFEETRLYDPESAVAYWQKRVPLTDSEAKALLTEVKSTEQAIRSAGIQYSKTVMDAVTETFAKANAEGMSLSEFRKTFNEVVPGRASATIEQIYRTNQTAQYGQERLQTIRGAGVRAPFMQLLTVPDDRRTLICKAMANYIAASTDDIWDMWCPPNHYQCRDDLSPIPYLEAIRRGLAQKTPDGKGLILLLGSRPFGNPPDFFEDGKGNLIPVIPQDGFRRGQKVGIAA